MLTHGIDLRPVIGMGIFFSSISKTFFHFLSVSIVSGRKSPDIHIVVSLSFSSGSFQDSFSLVFRQWVVRVLGVGFSH